MFLQHKAQIRCMKHIAYIYMLYESNVATCCQPKDYMPITNKLFQLLSERTPNYELHTNMRLRL
jgi:hypothetical protein